MALFYVRPRCDAGYGSGDGGSFDNAFNGFEAIDWTRLQALKPSWLTICGAGDSRHDLVTVQVEWMDASAEKSPLSRRESSQPV